MAKRKSKVRYKEGDFLKVIWLDAFSVDDWTSSEDVKDINPCEIWSVGICKEHTDDKITLAVSHDLVNNNYSCIKTIPTGMITKIEELKVK